MYSLVLMMALTGSAEVPAGHGCHGCCGGCHGCHGCRGRHGCCGGGYGCYGCCGGYYGCCGGCYGCYGGCYGYGCCGGMMAAPAAPAAPTAPAKPKEKEASNAAPATILVSLPADAQLTIDGAATNSTSANRVFTTPALNNGSEYYYTLKAQVTRGGKVLSTTRRVAVRAGEASRVTLDVPAATGVASK
jgi:uncharacterized protein (TIGR03000 family)